MKGHPQSGRLGRLPRYPHFPVRLQGLRMIQVTRPGMPALLLTSNQTENPAVSNHAQQKEASPSGEALFICQFEATLSGFPPPRLVCHRRTWPSSDFPQSAFRAEHDPFYGKAVALGCICRTLPSIREDAAFSNSKTRNISQAIDAKDPPFRYISDNRIDKRPKKTESKPRPPEILRKGSGSERRACGNS